MSASPGPLSELISAHLAGELTDEQKQVLNELLRNDPDARSQFAAALRRDVLLGEVLREEVAGAEGDLEAESRSSAGRPGRDSGPWRRAPLPRRSQTSWLTSAAAAALIAGAIGLVIFLSTKPSHRPDPFEGSARAPRPAVPPIESPVVPSPKEEVPKPARELAEGRRPVPVERSRARKGIETVPSAPEKPLNEPDRAAPPAPDPEDQKPPLKPRVPAPPTVSAVAVVGRVEGEAFLVAGKNLVAARPGTEIGERQGFRTIDGASRAFVRFKDGTELELTGDTRLKELSETKGKRFFLERGRIRLDVAKQPAGKPLVVATPHSEVQVLGTTFTVAVETGTTRVAVQSGRVRVAGAGGSRIDLKAGRYVVAGPRTTRLRDGRILDFQDGLHPVPAYAGTRDTYVAEDHPSDRYNHQKRVHVDAKVRDGVKTTLSGLLRWDLEGIPKGSRVQAVSIALHVTQPTNDRWGLYPLRRAWSESDVTWNCPVKDDFWQTPGARGPEDRDTGSVGSVVPRHAGLNEFFVDPEGVALVQSWIDAPSRNHGFIFAGTETGGWIFTSRETDVKEHRPRITVYFQPAGRR